MYKQKHGTVVVEGGWGGGETVGMGNHCAVGWEFCYIRQKNSRDLLFNIALTVRAVMYT